MTGSCRFCDKILDFKFLDLGTSPLSNSFIKEENRNESENFYPLRVYVCKNCFLVQLEEFERPKNIFSDYAYFSSYSKSWLTHAEVYVNLMIKRFGFDKHSYVVEIASNDGYLLQFFKMRNIPFLGIEPARNVAAVAIKKGINTLTKFFNVQIAQELAKNQKQADLIIGNNVFAHVPNLNDFVKGLKILLKPSGIITLEFPHLLELMRYNQFDTIYHEHFSYFSLKVVEKIFLFHDLEIFDVDRLDTHGGSLRVYVKHKENNELIKNEDVSKIINIEDKFGLSDLKTYSEFAKKVELHKNEIQKFFQGISDENKKIAGFGAAAKGNTLLNYCKITPEFLEYVVDNNPHKQGCYLPGTHIPIKKPDLVRDWRPDYVLIIPWNLKVEISNELKYIRNWGGKFVTLIPRVEVF